MYSRALVTLQTSQASQAMEQRICQKKANSRTPWISIRAFSNPKISTFIPKPQTKLFKITIQIKKNVQNVNNLPLKKKLCTELMERYPTLLYQRDKGYKCLAPEPHGITINTITCHSILSNMLKRIYPAYPGFTL